MGDRPAGLSPRPDPGSLCHNTNSLCVCLCVCVSGCVCVRIEAKHSELRDRQARGRGPPPDVEDDDGDPNYARINNFRERQSPPRSPYSARTPSPQRPHASAHAPHPAPEEALDGLYAKVNKQRTPPHTAPVSPDR